MDKSTVILGIGGGAGKILATVESSGIDRTTRLIHVDTDRESLTANDNIQSVLVQNDWVNGSGCSGDQNLGENAIEFSKAELVSAIGECGVLVVVACLGRGTATGGIHALNRLIGENKLVGIFFVTLPFSFEGRTLGDAAANAVKTLRKDADIVIAVKNDTLFEPLPREHKAVDTFNITNRVLSDGLCGLVDLTCCANGMIPVDMGRVRKLFKKREAYSAIGRASTEDIEHTTRLVDDVLATPMLKNQRALDSADAVIAALVGSEEMTIGSMTACLDELNRRLKVRIQSIIGAHVVEGAPTNLTITVIAIQFGKMPQQASRKRRRESSNVLTGESAEESSGSPHQPSLPFHEAGFCLGIFSEIPATMINNQNLDIPTFQRKEIVLDAD